ncbi:MAG: hypothetical protein M5U34_44835 [Chloroflexi bacterium]|nr:hypothetical protein [Chloroflexota bacterium]
MIANSAETTLILYGQYAIGEYKINTENGEQWQYYLGDAHLSVRQLVDDSGMVLLARTYAPYGILLTQTGSGASLFGYAGGQSGVSGLWYFGSGYFDPQTGQFLAQETNPLTPLAASVLANPGGLLFGPLMLWNWRRRKKGGKLPPTGLFVLALIFTIGLVGCSGTETGTPTPGAPIVSPEVNPTRVPTASATWIPAATSTRTAVELSPTPCLDCTESPGNSTTDSAPTVTPTGTPPQPTPLYKSDELVTFDDTPIPTPVPTATTEPTPEPTLTPHPNGFKWTEAEKDVVRQAARDVASKLARTMNDKNGWKLSDEDAFHLVYGESVEFRKTGLTCQQDNGAVGCWARTKSSTSIHVFTHANIRDTASKSSYHWTVHELGHAFVDAVGDSDDPVDTLARAIDEKVVVDGIEKLKCPHLGRPPAPKPGEDAQLWGFAGGYLLWQMSWSKWDSEVFADMFVGWTYDSWQMVVDADGNNVLHPDGEVRANFMNTNMPIWIEAAIYNDK